MRKQSSGIRSSLSCNPRQITKQTTSLNESQVTSLMTQNQKLHEQNGKLIEQLEIIRMEYESLTTSGIQSVKSSNSKRIEFQINENDIAKLKQQKEKLIIDNEFLRRTIQKLQIQIDEQRKEIEKLENSQNDYEQLKQRLEETVFIVNDLEIQLQEQFQQQKQYEYNQKMITLNSQETFDQMTSHQKMNEIQIIQLKEQNIKLNRLLEERLIQLENITKILNQRNEAYNQLQLNYDQDLKQKNTNTKQDVEKQGLQKEIKELKQQIQNKRKVQSISKDFVNDDKGKKIIELNQKLQFKEEQIKQLEQLIKEQQQQSQQIQSVIAANSYANNQQQQNLQKQLQAIVQELQQYKQQNEKLIFENNQLRIVNSTLNDKLKFQGINSQQNLKNDYSQSFVTSPGRNDKYTITTSPVLTNRTNIMPLNPPDSPFRKQKLHLLFVDEQQKNANTNQNFGQNKKIVQITQRQYESEQKQQSNKDRFLLID